MAAAMMRGLVEFGVPQGRGWATAATASRLIGVTVGGLCWLIALLVPLAGIEPALLAELDFETEVCLFKQLICIIFYRSIASMC